MDRTTLTITQLKEAGMPTSLAQLFYSFVKDAEYRGSRGEEYNWAEFYPRVPKIMEQITEETNGVS